MTNNWHIQTIEKVFQKLQTNKHGLTKKEAIKHLEKYGPNKLPEGKVDTLLIIFLRQFQSPLIYILIVASITVFALGEIVDGSIIAAVLLFNAIIGTIQEGKAQNTLLALNKFVETKATVLREGSELIIPDKELVPGDIIILQEGEKIPADARVITAVNFALNEASLTGESEPKHKTISPLDKKELPITEQSNMLFKGSLVLDGNGKAVVVATGIDTVIGKISKEISTIDTEIPLKTNVRYLSHIIITVVATISVLLFSFGVIAGNPMKEMFVAVVALAISIIPEGLPIVITLVLAAGVWRMSKQNALVKKLQAVEALGQAQVIAVDKTGTITRNELVIQKAYVDGKIFEIEGYGYEPKGSIKLNDNIVGAVDHPELLLAGKIAAFCANARVKFSEEDELWRVTGDPTEAAMLVFAEKLGLCKDDLERRSPRIGEIPFNYKRKYHATAHQLDNKKCLAIVGAPEIILKLSQKIWQDNKNIAISKEEKIKLHTALDSLLKEGLRVVALAKADIEETDETLKILTPEKIGSLSFVGFLGMKDALRQEVAEAMQKTTSAGIRVVMITGDHKLTAQAIAKEAGIYKENDIVLTGEEIDLLSGTELSKKLPKTSVFARVTPDHKLKIINAYKATGKIIAMTGDGVNDAPSLVAADLGVAMGKGGTEVAKEAADIILLDDNFGSIVSAVEEGRSIYKTIKKASLFLFSTSLGETLAISSAILLGFPLPILPAQIIWLNFVTDGFLDVALAMEPKESRLLSGKFTRSKKYLVDKLMIQRMLFMAIPMMLGTLFIFKEFFDKDLAKAWTMSFTTLAVFQWLNAWNCRHELKSIFQINPLSNKFLLGAMFIVIPLQLLAIYNPLLQKLLHTVPLNFSEWLIIVTTAISVIFTEEIRKFFSRKNKT